MNYIRVAFASRSLDALGSSGMNCAPYANPVTAVNIRAFFCEIIDADVDIVVDTPTRNDSNVTRRARADRGLGDW